MGITIYPFYGAAGTDGLAPVATSGAYSDLTGRPTLGTAAAKDAQTSATDVTAGRLQLAQHLSQAPAILDARRWAVERASHGRNSILYNAMGEEIEVVLIDACSYADLGTAYTTGMNGTGLLEAFSVSGVAKPYLFIGKYPASRSASGLVVCQAGADPWHTIDYDESVAACAALGTLSGHASRLMSTWDWAAIAHRVMASGRGQPKGNTDYGRAYDAKWQTARRIDGALPGITTGTPRSRSGSGPREWAHDLSDSGVFDLVGNVFEWQCGMKLAEGVVSLAADNGTVTTEANWANTGFSMPASTTWSTINNTGASDALKRALIVPATGVTSPAGYCYTTLTGERLPIRGGGWSGAGGAGLAALNLGNARGSRSTSIGFRPAFVP